MLASPGMAQPDTARIDSLLMAQVMQGYQANDSIKKAEKNFYDTVKLVPADRELIQFYANSGIMFDTLCSNLDLYKEIYGWLGVRYRYAGLTKRGVDCAGFVKNISNRIYGTKLSGSARDHYAKCVAINKEDLQEGDLVFFKINHSQISHVGMYLGNNKFVHASVKKGVMINDLDEKYYAKYYYISGRIVKTLPITQKTGAEN